MGPAELMRFNYLRNARPHTLERLGNARVSDELKWPLTVLATVACATLGAHAMLLFAIGNAALVEREAQARFDRSKVAVARVRLERTRVDDLVSLDRRLRGFRSSGNFVAARLADIGNRMPPHAWLTALSRGTTGVTIAGKSVNLPTLGATIESLTKSKEVSSPALVRASEEPRVKSAGLISFEVNVEVPTR